MKSLHSAEISSKASSSKSQVQEVTLASVSLSLSPMKGDRPLTLVQGSNRETHMEELTQIYCCAVHFHGLVLSKSKYCDDDLCSQNSLLIHGSPYVFLYDQSIALIEIVTQRVTDRTAPLT